MIDDHGTKSGTCTHVVPAFHSTFLHYAIQTQQSTFRSRYEPLVEHY